MTVVLATMEDVVQIFRFAVAGIGLCLAAVQSATAQSSPTHSSPILSATKSRDIGGFMLGMSIRDAAKLTRIEALGNDDFQAIRDGITYDFGVTPKGRIYRISSDQPLGRFAVDRSFLNDLAAKLTVKYGPPHDRTGNTFGWGLNEPVQRSDGRTLPFQTMWASAYVDDDMEGVTVHMKMIDFRILWADQKVLNETPRDRAKSALTF